MSRDDLQNLFWTMGASGKNTPLARQAGCVGHFGVGGFANFGVCRILKVSSKRLDQVGWESMVSIDESTASGVPEVVYMPSDVAGPHGTVVEAELTAAPNVNELSAYLESFVRFVPEPIHFNNKLISQSPMLEHDGISYGPAVAVEFKGSTFEAALGYEADKTPVVRLVSGDEAGGIGGILRFSSGTTEVFKRGFKLCSTAVSSTLGVRGRLEADTFQPTAGRDSLSAESQHFAQQLVQTLERVVAATLLKETDLIAANPRVVPLAVSTLGIDSIGQMPIRLAGGRETTLQVIRDQFNDNKSPVYFGRSGDKDVLHILEASGNVIVLLSGDGHWQSAQKSYLSSFCAATSFEGLIQIKERYTDLSTFELAFLAELEAAVRYRYDVQNFELVPAAITGGIPAHARSGPGRLTIHIDVRHPEVSKLHQLGFSPVLYSMATEFCREYLSTVLKSNSPKFFGSGALNIDEIIRRREELWKIEAADIAVDPRGEAPRQTAHYGGVGIAQVVTSAGIAHMEVGAPGSDKEPTVEPAQVPGRDQKILKIIDLSGTLGIAGCYFRIMDAPAKTFGNEIQTMTEVFAFWFGNKVTYVFSDGIRTAFQYELRLDAFVLVDGDAGGTVRLSRPIQQFGSAMFVEIPETLERFLVPTPERDVFVTVNYDWIDLSEGKALLAGGHNGDVSPDRP